MKQLRQFMVLILILTGFNASAEIREMQSLRQLPSLLTPETLVIFDLDNTVFEPAQTLGSDQFFSFLVKKAEAQGMQGQTAINWALQQSTPIQPVSKVRPVENLTPTLIKTLQQNRVRLFALTARPPQWHQGTLQQLYSLGVDFSRTAPPSSPQGNTFPGGVYTQGVIFLSAGSDKGKTLMQFFHQTKINPSRVLFIDDKLHNVQSVDTALTLAKIRNLNLRYGAADARVKSFNPALADFEYQYFLRFRIFLPDEVALKMMGQKN